MFPFWYTIHIVSRDTWFHVCVVILNCIRYACEFNCSSWILSCHKPPDHCAGHLVPGLPAQRVAQTDRLGIRLGRAVIYWRQRVQSIEPRRAPTQQGNRAGDRRSHTLLHVVVSPPEPLLSSTGDLVVGRSQTAQPSPQPRQLWILKVLGYFDVTH